MKLGRAVAYIVLLMSVVLLHALQPLSAQTNTLSFANESRLAKGKWVKIKVARSGMHRITHSELKKMGFADPSKVRIFGYGGAQLSESFGDIFIDDLPEAPIYNCANSIVFYAQGPVQWRYDADRSFFAHQQNTYSNEAFYFITDRYGAPQSLHEQTLSSTDTTISSYYALFVDDDDRINLINSGRCYLGHEFNQNAPSCTLIFEVDNILQEPSKLCIKAAHTAKTNATIDVYVNNAKIGALALPTNANLSNYVHATGATELINFTPTSSNRMIVKLVYSYPQSKGYLDYVELNLRRRLVKNAGEPLVFDHEAIGKSAEFCLQSSENDIIVWDVSELDNFAKLAVVKAGSVQKFASQVDRAKRYAVFSPENDNMPSPELVGSVDNQNLHAAADYDMLIISDPEFIDQAERLARMHAQIDRLNTLVATPDQIYNEFSSGTPDATAYRLLAKMLYQRGSLQYLLFMGGGSFDNRKILSANTLKNVYRTLTYQSEESFVETRSYCTDDYFGMLGDGAIKNILNERMQIAVGRIPANTYEDAKAAVDKTLRYATIHDYGKWKNLAIFIADDGDENEHVQGADAICSHFQNTYPALLTRKLYLDSYKQQTTAQGESYPTLKKEFDDYIKNGVLIVNYVGHGGFNGWANEQILTLAEIENMRNSRLPLWITATCDFAQFDNFKETSGERLMLNPNGGACALITTTRTVFSRPNLRFNSSLGDKLLEVQPDGRLCTIGEACRYAKNKQSEMYDENRLCFILLGDPALRLDFPTTHDISIDSINGAPVDEAATIGALDKVTFKGGVIDKGSSAVDSEFNGVVSVSVYDKEELVRTLCNDATDKGDFTPFEYLYRPNPVFVGEAAVERGEFEISFVVPKDIKYNVGEGRVVAYAYDAESEKEANGNFTNFTIGGENIDAELEFDGPEISAYLNNIYFRNGDITNSSPLFIAKVSDQSGINTIGSGIGHDIILKIDGNPNMEYVLNNYYQADFGMYTQGTIYFQLSALTQGEHTLFFRVWDLQNNSSSVQLNFVVDENSKMMIEECYAAPNPACDVTQLYFTHNRPSTSLRMQLSLHNTSGNTIQTTTKNLTSDNSGMVVVPIESLSSLPDGLYFIRVLIEDEDGKKAVKTTKLLIRKQ